MHGGFEQRFGAGFLNDIADESHGVSRAGVHGFAASY
jgi:hypothetical protein